MGLRLPQPDHASQTQHAQRHKGDARDDVHRQHRARVLALAA